MDENTYLLITLLIVEVATLFSTVATGVFAFLKNEDNKIRKSSCCGGAIEYNDGEHEDEHAKK